MVIQVEDVVWVSSLGPGTLPRILRVGRKQIASIQDFNRLVLGASHKVAVIEAEAQHRFRMNVR